MTAGKQTPRLMRLSHVERLAGALSERDFGIIDTLGRLRLATSLQIERLHFHTLTGNSRVSVRRRVLRRLTRERVLALLEPRVGTARRGAGRRCYTLDVAGQQLQRWRTNCFDPEARTRRPHVPGDRFVGHTLAVTELYVDLVERSRLGRFTLARFDVEPVWPDGSGGWLRPDAFVQLGQGTRSAYWWYEADMATESLPTLKAKLEKYLRFYLGGQRGQDEVMPWVLVGVPSAQRLAAIQGVSSGLPPPAEAIFRVALIPEIAGVMRDVLRSD